jgi:deoxyribonuclease V
VIVAVDVDYRADAVVTACVGFAGWADAATEVEWVATAVGAAAPYEPGEFYRRELPYLLTAVAAVKAARVVDAAVVDAHAWLDAGRPGLGAHLATALGGAIVIGVAKTRYRGGAGLPVLRGNSRTPLWVSAVGIDAAAAAELVRGMHGPYRLPTLLARVDGLARGRVAAEPSKRLG